jgi:hypothetical protein
MSWSHGQRTRRKIANRCPMDSLYRPLRLDTVIKGHSRSRAALIRRSVSGSAGAHLFARTPAGSVLGGSAMAGMLTTSAASSRADCWLAARCSAASYGGARLVIAGDAPFCGLTDVMIVTPAGGA